MSGNRFSFKNLLPVFFQKAAPTGDGPISHPSQLDSSQVNTESVTSSASAMRIGAVNACVTKLSNLKTVFPVMVYKQTGEKTRKKLPDHWLMKLLRAPMRGMSYWSWSWLLQYYFSFRGKIYCRKVWSRGVIVELQPINPDRVYTYRDAVGEIRHDIYHMNRPPEMGLTSNDIWYVMSATLDGTNGVGPIDLQRELMEGAYQMQQYASNSLRNDGFTGLVFSFAGRLMPETREAMKKDWEEKSAGPRNAGRPLLLEEGAKAERLTMTLEQAQFIEARGMSRTDIAAMFGFPPHLVGDLTGSNFNTLEQMSLELVTFTLTPWTCVWEYGYEDLLGDEAPDIYVKHNMNALLRGDQKSRYESYSSAISAQWMVPNEARGYEDMDPIKGGDEVVKKPALGDEPGKPQNPTKPRNDDR